MSRVHHCQVVPQGGVDPPAVSGGCYDWVHRSPDHRNDTLLFFKTSGIFNNLKSYYDLRSLRFDTAFILYYSIWLLCRHGLYERRRGGSFKLTGWDLMIAGKLDWVHDDPIAKNTCQTCHGLDGFLLLGAHGVENNWHHLKHLKHISLLFGGLLGNASLDLFRVLRDIVATQVILNRASSHESSSITKVKRVFCFEPKSRNCFSQALLSSNTRFGKVEVFSLALQNWQHLPRKWLGDGLKKYLKFDKFISFLGAFKSFLII